jgi:hypothetical protein
MSRGSGPHLLAELSSGAATCSSAPDLTSLSRWTPTLPRVLQLWISPPCRGRLRRCHVAPPSPPREESSGAATYPTTPQRAVSKTRSHVTEASARRVDKPLQFGSTEQRRPSWSLLDIATVVIRPDRTAPQL